MDTKSLLRRARTLFHCGIPRIDRHNRHSWFRSVQNLGTKWVNHPERFAQPARQEVPMK
jgi:hypothetical protein